MNIAVVVVTYNSGATLARCVDALTKQSLKPARILIIDNASPNGFPSDRIAGRADIELVRNPFNVGFAAANNQALAMLEKDPHIEWVATVNPDAFPEPEWLAEMAAAANRYPDCDAFASRLMVDATDNVIDGLGDEYHISGLAWRSRHGRPLQPTDLLGREVFAVCAGAALYRLCALEQLGGFDIDLFCYMEDVDLSFRMQRRGMRCRYVPSAVAWHVGGESTRDNPEFRLYYGHRNMILVYLTNMPPALLLLTLPVHIVVNLIGVVRSLLRGEILVVLRAKWHALKLFGRVRAKRRRLERAATVGSWQLWSQLSKSLRRDLSSSPIVPVEQHRAMG